MKIAIIGYGVVGKNMHKVFPNAIIHDTKLGMDIDDEYCDLAFVCVPTEKRPDGSVNTTVVESVIRNHAHHVSVFCIRSTIPPGTTERLTRIYTEAIVFSPEYFGGTIHSNHYNYDFLIFGGERKYTKVVAEAYRQVMHSELKILQTDSKTAELCKYMENSWLALKVTFCNEFSRIAAKIGVDYNELRELWLADPRINRSHTFVFDDQPYYDSHCLNKDIPGLIKFAESIWCEASLMKAVDSVNNEQRQK